MKKEMEKVKILKRNSNKGEEVEEVLHSVVPRRSLKVQNGNAMVNKNM